MYFGSTGGKHIARVVEDVWCRARERGLFCKKALEKKNHTLLLGIQTYIYGSYTVWIALRMCVCVCTFMHPIFCDACIVNMPIIIITIIIYDKTHCKSNVHSSCVSCLSLLVPVWACFIHNSASQNITRSMYKHVWKKKNMDNHMKALAWIGTQTKHLNLLHLTVMFTTQYYALYADSLTVFEMFNILCFSRTVYKTTHYTLVVNCLSLMERFQLSDSQH